jgi:hypothetical protein
MMLLVGTVAILGFIGLRRPKRPDPGGPDSSSTSTGDGGSWGVDAQSQLYTDPDNCSSSEGQDGGADCSDGGGGDGGGGDGGGGGD